MIKSYNTWVTFSAQLLIISLFLPIRWGGLAVIIFSAVSAVGFAKKKYKLQRIKALSLLPALFFILVLGSFYAEDKIESWRLIERSFSFLLLPLISQSLTVLTKVQWRNLFHTYLLSALGISLICLLIATDTYLKTGSSSINNSDHFIYNIFMHQRLTSPLSLHAIYLNCFISFGGLLVLNQFITKWNQLSTTLKIAYSVYLLFNGIMFYLLKSSILSAAFPLILGTVYFNRIKNYILTSKTTIFISLISAVLVAGFFYSVIKTKLGDFAIKEDYSAESIGPLTIRIATWEGAFRVIKNDWLLGVGTGNLEKPILKEFETIKFSEGLDNKYNAHNMYLQYWAMNGLLGIGTFILLLLALLFKGIKNNNKSLISLVLLFAIFSLTESTLQTQRGILFFSFTICWMYWNNSTKEINP